MRIVLPALIVLALLPATTASAVTGPEIVALTKAGVSEQVILALIERDKTIFAIGPEQLLALQKDGVSDVVILAMIRSGRQEVAPQPAAAVAPSAPSAPYEAPAPNVVVVGDGPDRPNTPDGDNGYNPYSGYAGYGGQNASVVTYFVPVPYPVYTLPIRGTRPRRPPPRVPFQPPSFQSVVPPAPATSAPGVNGIFFSTPARGVFFDR